MGAVLGRALVAPRWTGQQEPVVGNWSRLSASAGDTGAAPGPPGRDGRRQGGGGGEDEPSLRELRRGQVGWDSVNTRLRLPFSSAFAPGPVPCPLANVVARAGVGSRELCALVLYVQLLKFTLRTSCSPSFCFFFSTAPCP